MGLSRRQQRSKKCNRANPHPVIRFNSLFEFIDQLWNASGVQIFQWIFVSLCCFIVLYVQFGVALSYLRMFYSIAGSSATIYAYLGEFHSSRNRSKVLMTASFIYGLACCYMPILGFFVLNRTFHFHIPIFNILYKPWRFYLLFCGLPSLVCAIVVLFIPESPKFTFSKVWA